MQHTQAVGTGGAETDLDRVAWIEKRPILGPSIGKGPGPGTQQTIGGDTVKHGPFFYKVYPRTRAPIPLTPEEEVSEEEEVQDEEVPEEEEKQAAQGAQEDEQET